MLNIVQNRRVKTLMSDLESTMHRFKEFVKTMPMGVDRKEHIFLVGINHVWEDAVEAFIQHELQNNQNDCSQ